MNNAIFGLYEVGVVIFGLFIGTIFGVSAHELYKLFKYGRKIR